MLKKPPGIWDLPDLPEIGSPLSEKGLISESQRILSKNLTQKDVFLVLMVHLD